MTTGKQLKSQLGLDKLKNVKIARFIISSYKIYGVFYDSYRDIIVTNHRISQSPKVATIFSGTGLTHNQKKYTITTPPQDIEDFNGAIKGSLVIPIDLAGDLYLDDRKFTKHFESTIQFNGNLKEFVTFSDLNNTANISDLTMKYRKKRTALMGAENTQVKLIDCYIDEADNSVRFAFLTTVTPYPDDDDHEYKDANPEKGWKLQDNPAEVYELQLKILNFHQWLDTFNGDEVTGKDIKDIMEVAYVQVSSTSPSFHWQGVNYNLSLLDASIYPTDIPNKVWGKRHDPDDPQGYFLDKHLYGLIRQIKFFINPMASMLTKKLKDRDLI